MKKILSIIFFLASILIHTQGLEGNGNAVLYDSLLNRISDKDSCLYPVYKKMKDIENGLPGEVCIYQLGDSHINAGYFPYSFSEDMKSVFGDKGGIIFRTQERMRRRIPGFVPPIQESAFHSRYSGYLAADSLEISTFDSVKNNENSKHPKKSAGVRFYSYGVTGRGFPYFAADNVILDHFTVYKPDLVIISLGTNDIYGGSYNEQVISSAAATLISRIRHELPDVPILFTFPADCYIRQRSPNPNMPKICSTLVSLCSENKCAFWDLFSIMGGSGSMQIWYDKNLTAYDKIHFNSQGYSVMGHLLFEAFMKGYEGFLTMKNKSFILK